MNICSVILGQLCQGHILTFLISNPYLNLQEKKHPQIQWFVLFGY
ncbi:hypothetical protein CWATWH0005_2488 [Crocosphaera watsonii WH 0005]|uniref:Uncharacterized protein n=1 Tax=Crocosphaera watsonii WH 0005 TaxID=423472 RepID=T2J1M4_CROWT|nr:hypothetical protein CWATWH0005_2488 [Crocosphaera watsonii WH 0005]